MKELKGAAAVLVLAAGFSQPVQAGDYSGDFMVRVLGAGVLTQDNLKSLTNNGAPIPGLDASISDEFIPAATLTYFFTKNIAAELFCCFATHQARVSGGVGEVADFWIFPPAVTLQYHFDPMHGFKPYVGAGLQ